MLIRNCWDTVTFDPARGFSRASRVNHDKCTRVIVCSMLTGSVGDQRQWSRGAIVRRSTGAKRCCCPDRASPFDCCSFLTLGA
jgi:hypothetical protein